MKILRGRYFRWGLCGRVRLPHHAVEHRRPVPRTPPHRAGGAGAGPRAGPARCGRPRSAPRGRPGQPPPDTSCVTSSAVKRSRRHSVLDQPLHLDARERVQRAERLVEQQQARVVHQRPRQRHALPLAAREPRGPFARRARPAPPGPARLAASSRRRAARPSVTLSSTRFHGSRRASWNMIADVLAHRLADLASLLSMLSGAAIRGLPSPATSRSSVLLPQPLRPTMATNSPGCDCEVDAVQHLPAVVALDHLLHAQGHPPARSGVAGVAGVARHRAAPGAGRPAPPRE